MVPFKFLAASALCALVGCSSDPTPAPAKADASGMEEVDDQPTNDAVVVRLIDNSQHADGGGETTAAPGSFGATCKNGNDCDSGWCIQTLIGWMCTQSCESNCPDGFVCRQKTIGSDVVSICMPQCTPEVCNIGEQIDDDCDGLISEGLCNDGNVCTIDLCNNDGTCKHDMPNGLACNDGDQCTQVDECYAGVCKGGKPMDCTDDNPCTQNDVCDPVIGCMWPPQAGPCSDGDECTTGDFCKEGTCHGGPPLVCTDTNPCTYNGKCDPATGCYFEPIPNGVNTACPKGKPNQIPWCDNGACTLK